MARRVLPVVAALVFLVVAHSSFDTRLAGNVRGERAASENEEDERRHRGKDATSHDPPPLDGGV